MPSRLRAIVLTGNLLLVTFAVFTEPPACLATTILGGATPLSSLVGNAAASIAAGDKLFTGFQYSSLGDMPASASINVFPILDDDGDYGLRFQGTFADLPGGPSSDAYIRYTVATAEQRFVQTGAKLTGGLTAGPESFFAVDQQFQGSNTLLNIYASGLGPSPPPPHTDDAEDFAAHLTMFTVTTDLLASAASGGSAALTHFDQTYKRLLLGDYDRDEDVDGNDFLVWQRELGASGPVNADGSGNGTVDAADLAVWRENFGATAALGVVTSEATKIPEPTSGFLLAVALVALHHKRRRGGDAPHIEGNL